MRTSLSAATIFLSALQLATAQTFTDCDPTKKTCPANPGLGGTVETDFTKGKNDAWTYADGTTINYDPAKGAVFSIAKSTNAPTMAFSKYIMFGKVSVVMQAAPGAGIVSSFILESADLDEIDWEWIGAVDMDAQSNFFGKGNTSSYDRGAHHAMPVSPGAVNGFHTYEIDWNKDAIKWSIDGNSVRTLPYSSPLALGGQNYPQTPMKVKMGSWVGCASKEAASDPKTQGTCEWASGPADFASGPFDIDMTGSYQSIKSSGKCDGNANTVVSSSESVPAITGSATGSVTSTGSAVSTSVSTTAKSSSASASASASGSSTLTSAVKEATQAAAANGTGTVRPSLNTAVSPVPTGPSASASNAAAAATAASGASRPSHKYGAMDIGVMVLGLGLGYLVM
ncbi:putative glycosidase crf1 [Glarea lozoyensis 74030]|uniref:Putative glycosidase crf1 n=1 Tax=Glarea lozoyensis (strain ATCC 74030 / MF5533) TaxID=1104152 RepID=H0EEC9_GLAL7|nr:putative glycosidase crf1 [Glarea lozoyensis 74030]